MKEEIKKKLDEKLTSFIRSWNASTNDMVAVEDKVYSEDLLLVLFKRTCNPYAVTVNAYSMLYVFSAGEDSSESRAYYEKFLFARDSADWNKYLRKIISTQRDSKSTLSVVLRDELRGTRELKITI